MLWKPKSRNYEKGNPNLETMKLESKSRNHETETQIKESSGNPNSRTTKREPTSRNHKVETPIQEQWNGNLNSGTDIWESKSRDHGMGSLIQEPGYENPNPGNLKMNPKSRTMILKPDFRSNKVGIQIQKRRNGNSNEEPRSRNSDPGTEKGQSKSSNRRTRNQIREPRNGNLDPGTKCESYSRNPKAETRILEPKPQTKSPKDQ